MDKERTYDIKAIIGLGNPGDRFYNTRHNIGFRVVDALVDQYHEAWRTRDEMEVAELAIDAKKIIVIKPLTFMNASGKVIPYLLKKGIKPEQIVIVHDELEKPFGAVGIKFGGSARGHNGLRSVIAACGPDFVRLYCGIGRPEHREMVGDYVLNAFDNTAHDIQCMLNKAVIMLIKLVEGGKVVCL